jgi:hypothetical protein
VARTDSALDGPAHRFPLCVGPSSGPYHVLAGDVAIMAEEVLPLEREESLKSLNALQQVVLKELGTRCGTSTDRDQNTITARVEREGLSFLTITLPNFCKDFEKSLEQEFVDHDQFPGFARTGGLPRFLGGFLDLVFDRSSSRLLDQPSIDAIRSIRQITLMFGKIKIDCSEERINRAIKAYIKCEQDVRLSDLALSSEPNRFEEFSKIGRLL